MWAHQRAGLRGAQFESIVRHLAEKLSEIRAKRDWTHLRRTGSLIGNVLELPAAGRLISCASDSRRIRLFVYVLEALEATLAARHDFAYKILNFEALLFRWIRCSE